MTYLKTTSIAMALAAILGAGSALAGDTPPTFSDLDTDANGQVSFSEFAKYKEKEGKTLTNAQRQFNVISGGSESFSAEQYEKSFAVKGEVDARETDSVVVMPSESTAVKGAVDSGVIVDEFDETPDADPQVQDEQPMSDDAMDTESTMETDSVDTDVMLDTETDVQTETVIETDLGLEENEIALDPDVPSAFETTTDSDVGVETGVEGDAILQTDPALESPTLENPALENEVMSDTETTIDSPQVEGSELNIDPTVDAVTGETDTSYETEFSVPEAPETPSLEETDPVVESEMESDVELQENMTLEEDSDVDLDIKSDVETDLETESDPN